MWTWCGINSFADSQPAQYGENLVIAEPTGASGKTLDGDRPSRLAIMLRPTGERP